MLPRDLSKRIDVLGKQNRASLSCTCYTRADKQTNKECTYQWKAKHYSDSYPRDFRFIAGRLYKPSGEDDKNDGEYGNARSAMPEPAKECTSDEGKTDPSNDCFHQQ